MDKDIIILVEGVYDKELIKLLISNFNEDNIRITDGWTNINSKIKGNEDKKILLIFDADNNPVLRRSEIQEKLKEAQIENFSLFLFPDNENPGDVENLLLKIVAYQFINLKPCFEDLKNCLEKNGYTNNPDNKAILHCWMGTIAKSRNVNWKKKKPKFYNIFDLDHLDLIPIKELLNKNSINTSENFR